VPKVPRTGEVGEATCHATIERKRYKMLRNDKCIVVRTHPTAQRDQEQDRRGPRCLVDSGRLGVRD